MMHLPMTLIDNISNLQLAVNKIAQDIMLREIHYFQLEKDNKRLASEASSLPERKRKRSA